jgi:hypothetical protein
VTDRYCSRPGGANAHGFAALVAGAVVCGTVTKVTKGRVRVFDCRRQRTLTVRSCRADARIFSVRRERG